VSSGLHDRDDLSAPTTARGNADDLRLRYRQHRFHPAGWIMLLVLLIAGVLVTSYLLGVMLALWW
jgi:hypothetical protein